jgi:hypothetical protein
MRGTLTKSLEGRLIGGWVDPQARSSQSKANAVIQWVLGCCFQRTGTNEVREKEVEKVPFDISQGCHCVNCKV